MQFLFITSTVKIRFKAILFQLNFIKQQLFKEFSPSTNMYIKKNVLKGMASTFAIKGNHTEDIKWYCFYCAIADSEEDLNSLSDSTSMTSTPQSEGKTPLSPRDFWREKDGSFMFVLFSLSKSHAVGHSAMGATWIEKW